MSWPHVVAYTSHFLQVSYCSPKASRPLGFYVLDMSPFIKVHVLIISRLFDSHTFVISSHVLHISSPHIVRSLRGPKDPRSCLSLPHKATILVSQVPPFHRSTSLLSPFTPSEHHRPFQAPHPYPLSESRPLLFHIQIPVTFHCIVPFFRAFRLYLFCPLCTRPLSLTSKPSAIYVLTVSRHSSATSSGCHVLLRSVLAGTWVESVDSTAPGFAIPSLASYSVCKVSVFRCKVSVISGGLAAPEWVTATLNCLEMLCLCWLL